MRRHFFKNFEFEFETTRLLWYIPSGGADYGEVANVTEKIIDGNYESWYQEWQKFANKLENRAQKFTSNIAKGNALLRASRYYQAAEFFLPPIDQRKIEVYQKSIDLFYGGLKQLQITYALENIEYKNSILRSVMFKTQTKSKGTIYICGGFDALLEELYFTNVNSALDNGYDVILYEGPGQSDVIRKFNLPFEEDWHIATRQVIEFYEKKYTLPEKRIGIGISLGGLLISRAASLDSKLFDKIVLFNYFPSMLDSFKKSMPKFLYKYFDTSLPNFLEKICSFYISKNKALNWQVEHAKWTFGEYTLNELLETCRKFNEDIALKQLNTATLMFLAENDNYYNYKLGINFFKHIPAINKKMIVYNKTDYSSDLHCQSGAFYESNDQIFEWLSLNK